MRAPSLEFTYALDRDQGARAYQEDSVGVKRASGSETSLQSPLLAVLADGMGGHVAGEKASQIAVSRYLESFSAAQGDIGQLLDRSLTASNDAIESEIRNSPMLAGMGCTLVAAYLNQDGLRWVSVGDSALLLYRGSTLLRLNEDHSLGALLDKQAQARQIAYEEAKNDPRRHALRSALVGADIHVKDLYLEPYPLHHGDWVILASDGLETLEGDEIATILGRRKELGDPSAAVKDLLDAVRKKAAPNQDNVSIIAIKVVDPADASTEIVMARKQVQALETLDTPEPASADDVGEAPENAKKGRLLPIALGVLALSLAGLLFAWRFLAPPLTGDWRPTTSVKTETPPAHTETTQQGPDSSGSLEKQNGPGKEETKEGRVSETEAQAKSETEPQARPKDAPKDKKPAVPNNRAPLATGPSRSPAKQSEHATIPAWPGLRPTEDARPEPNP